MPTPEFARHPAPGPDGNIYISVMHRNRISRLDLKSGRLTEHRVPSGGDPHTIVLDGTVARWFTVQNGQRVGWLDRATGHIIEYRASGHPYGLAVDAQADLP